MKNKVIKLFVLLVCAVLALPSCNKDKDKSSSDGSYRENKEKSEKYISNMKSSEGVRESSTGLLFKINELSTSMVRPELDDSVVAKIRCERFDGNCFSDTTSSFLVSDQVSGIAEGLMYMTEGSLFEFYVPYYLGFGSVKTSYSFNNKIVDVLPYSALHYTIELKQVIKQ